MKKLKLLLASICLLIISAFAFSACGGNKDDHKDSIASVTADGLETQYYVGQTIDFSQVGITLHLGKSVTISFKAENGVIDTPLEQITGAKFILLTDGLSEKGELTEADIGEYHIKCQVDGYEGTYDIMTIKVIMPFSSETHDLTSFTSDLVEDYNTHRKAATKPDNDVDGFKMKDVATDYYAVGDDNPFILTPKAELLPIDGETTETQKIRVQVEIKKDGQVVAAGTDYTFDADHYAIQFKDNACVGNVYTIKMTPVDFDLAESTNDPIELTVKVYDGWNAYDASDLAHLNMVENYDSSKECYRMNSRPIFYTESGYVRKNYYQIWKDYFDENEITIKQINGLFLHQDIEVNTTDLPADYLVTEAENEYAAGTVRDFAFIYLHGMPDATVTFNMNGNYNKINFNFPANGSWYDGDHDCLAFYTSDEDLRKVPSGMAIGFTGIAAMEGSSDAVISANNLKLHIDDVEQTYKYDSAKANVNNIYLIGNGGDVSKPSASLGCLNGVYVATNVDLTLQNVSIAKFASGIEADYTNDALTVRNSKVENCMTTGLCIWGTTGVKIYESVFRNFGGACILSTSGTGTGKHSVPVYKTNEQGQFVLDDQGNKIQEVDENGELVFKNAWDDVDALPNRFSASSVEIDEASILYSYVTGEEGWFAANKALSLVTMITASNSLIKDAGKATIIGSSDKFNLVLIALDTGAIASEKPSIHTTLSMGDTVYSSDTIRAFRKLVAQYAPAYAAACIYQSSENGTALTDLDQLMAFVNVTQQGLAIGQGQFATADDSKLYIDLVIPGTGAIAGLVVDLYPLPNQTTEAE